MMGHRDKLKGADEWDALCVKSKSLFAWRPGVRKRLKRRVNKRARQQPTEE